MKRKIVIGYLVLLSIFSVHAQEEVKKGGNIILIETTLGNIDILLYEETPLHRKNMLKLINESYYNGQIFHRVIKDFMIQGGDPHSAGAKRGQRLGTGGPGYVVPAEFSNEIIHKKGALAAARQGDNVNPEKSSSGSQFYIVQGKVYTEKELELMVNTGRHAPFTKKQIELYTTIGGTPHLDGAYTVFGEVINGLEVIDKIAAIETDAYDRPLEDIIYTITIQQ